MIYLIAMLLSAARANPREEPAKTSVIEQGDGGPSSAPNALACLMDAYSVGEKVYICCRDFAGRAARLEFVPGSPSPAELERLIQEWLRNEDGRAWCEARMPKAPPWAPGKNQ